MRACVTTAARLEMIELCGNICMTINSACIQKGKRHIFNVSYENPNMGLVRFFQYLR